MVHLQEVNKSKGKIRIENAKGNISSVQGSAEKNSHSIRGIIYDAIINLHNFRI